MTVQIEYSDLILFAVIRNSLLCVTATLTDDKLSIQADPPREFPAEDETKLRDGLLSVNYMVVLMGQESPLNLAIHPRLYQDELIANPKFLMEAVKDSADAAFKALKSERGEE